MGSGLMYGKLCLFVCITHTEMSLKNPHYLLGAFLTDTTHTSNILLNLSKINSRCIFLLFVSVSHKKRLQFLAGHFLNGAIGIAVYNRLAHVFTPPSPSFRSSR